MKLKATDERVCSQTASDSEESSKITLVPPPKEQDMSPSPRCAMQDVPIRSTDCGASDLEQGKYERKNSKVE